MSARDRAGETCADCQGPCWPGRFDRAPFLCDECYAMRDRWATEQEAKQTARKMLKADLPALSADKQKDVA